MAGSGEDVPTHKTGEKGRICAPGVEVTASRLIDFTGGARIVLIETKQTKAERVVTGTGSRSSEQLLIATRCRVCSLDVLSGNVTLALRHHSGAIL